MTCESACQTKETASACSCARAFLLLQHLVRCRCQFLNAGHQPTLSQLRHTPACQLLAFLSKRGRWLYSQAFVLLHRDWGGRTFTAVQQQIQNLEVIANSPSSTDTCPPEFLTLTTEIPSSHQICTPVTSKSPRPCTNWI